MQVIIRASGINPIRQDPARTAHAGRPPGGAPLSTCARRRPTISRARNSGCATKTSAAASVSAAHDRVPRYTIVSPPDALIVWPVM